MRRSLRPFDECMQDINSVSKRRDIYDPVSTGCVPHADLARAFANGFHWLPVVGVKAALNSLQLVTRITARALGKGPYSPKGVTQKDEWLHQVLISVLIYNV